MGLLFEKKKTKKLTTEFIIPLYSRATKRFTVTVILLTFKNTC